MESIHLNSGRDGLPSDHDDHIVHVREALMSRKGGGMPTLRTGHFLNYTITSIDDPVSELPLHTFSSSDQTRKWTEKVSFCGWRSPSPTWIQWVDSMAEIHKSVWRRAGIYEAILASKYQIKKHEDLIFSLVEKWSAITNTFIFPWGEASITLEDMIFSGGFSAVGNSILNPLRGDELKGTEEQLRKARKEIANTTNTKKPGQDAWMKEFMNSGSKLEHEAFLIVWLSRFVFPTKHEIIRKNVFPTAIQLARGIRIALAPAVLASIYRDLGLLKERIVNSSKPGSSEDENLMILSPFQCVQIWAWERIIELQPLPNSLKPGEPRLAQWHQKGLAPGLDDIRSVLDSARENFRWRPYTKPLKNLSLPKFYVEKDSWVSIDPSSDRGVVSLARCLRVSRLIGFGCLQPYFPHRVSLQFGYDQDLPGIVPESIQTPETAWKDYAKPITVGFLYVPSRYSEADFTVRYLKWWRQSVLTLQAENKQDSQQQSTRTKTSKAVKFAPTKKDPRNRSRPIKGYQETSEGKLNRAAKSLSSSRTMTKRTRAGHDQNGSPASPSSSEGESKQLKEMLAETNPIQGILLRAKGERTSRGYKMISKSSDRTKDGTGHKSNKTHMKSSRETKSYPDLPEKILKVQSQTLKGEKMNDSLAGNSEALPSKLEKRWKGNDIPTILSPEMSNAAPVNLDPPPENLAKQFRTEKDSSNNKHHGLKDGKMEMEEFQRTSRNRTAESSSERYEIQDSTGSSVTDIEAMARLITNLRSIQESPNSGELENEQEGGGKKIMYQIPKSQYEELVQGFQKVLTELQTIKSALNIN